MLVIRRKQMDVFRKVATRSFEAEMMLHLQTFAPQHCRVIGEEMMRRTVRLGLERADACGFTNRGPVRFYLEMMFMLGSDFDTDPQLPWAAESIKGQAHMDQMDRSHLLYEKAMVYLKNVAGPGNVYTVRALRRISTLAGRQLPPELENFDSEMLHHIQAAYPEKYAYVGEGALRTMIGEGVEGAMGFSFSTVRSKALFVVLMFALGHGFADDPLFPWVFRTLKDERIIDPLQRAERLEAKALTYLSHVLKYLEQK